MEKILGIDTGTNSLGWAIVEKNAEEYKLLEKGVNIFQEGVKIEKGIESSKAAERTSHRATRIRYYRNKLRKIRLLKILSDNHLCPPLSTVMLSAWRLKKEYPNNELFMQWQRTDDNEGRNPYAYRHKCLHKKLDLTDLTERYILGRALYHLNQRRGFLSNRKDQGSDDDGKVKTGISELTEQMSEAGCQYLGDYFYQLYNKGEKIRKHYTARDEHYLAEFHTICTMQNLDARLVHELEAAIFYQRPLKSQKGQVGHCVFEKNKTKCPASHPLYEEFRMLSFLNNVKIKTPFDETLRPLNNDERNEIMPLFYRKSKPDFDFEDIAKKLAPKKHYAFYKQASGQDYLFNFPMSTSVAGCPVTAQLKGIFGNNWQDAICEVYTLSEGKSKFQIVNDVWHALFFYSDEEKLAEFATNRLQLDNEQAKAFSKIRLATDYASLSLKAIRKILPYLRRGIIYSHAAFLGNVKNTLPDYVWQNQDMREAAIDNIVSVMQNYDSKRESRTMEHCIKDYLRERYNASEEALKQLYHPSMMETYPRVRTNDDGIYQLGSPRINSVRNPMAMRSMFRLRKLVNRLLAEKKIDEDTTIHIEFARELNDANKRKALADLTRENKSLHDKYRKAIIELYREQEGVTIEPTDRDILKYELWEEQGHRCVYTGKQIGITDFIGKSQRFDVEHTVPRSAGGDSTKMNLTLCDSRYNREVKGTHLPSELPDHDDILDRIKEWKDKWESLDKQIHKLRTRGLATKEAKDNVIKKRHKLILERDYWRGKYERFTMTQVPEGFSRRQGTDISIISKYARLYLKSVFKRVFVIKGIATSDFRKIWGLQDIYTKKERINHVHHCIDAIVIACIGPDEYSKLAEYYHDEEKHRWYGASKAIFTKPWSTFVEDVKRVENEILVSHYTPDNMAKQGKRRIKKDGKAIKENGKTIMAAGDAARSALHKDTYYGAIEKDGQIKYVQRKTLSSLEEKDVKNIVDETVRDIVERAIKEKGFKNAIAGTIWMNEEKRIPINKVRCYASSITNPLHIRRQRDLSTKEYKQQFHVANDSNYMMALYIGNDAKGKAKRDFKIVNMLDAARYFRTSNKKSNRLDLIPEKSPSGYPLAYTLKVGTMVLLYENSADEIWKADIHEQSRRLYKVTGMSSLRISKYLYGTIELRFHEEARPSGEIKAKNGSYTQNEEYRPAIRMYHSQLNALIQGYDFDINELGEIIRLR